MKSPKKKFKKQRFDFEKFYQNLEIYKQEFGDLYVLWNYTTVNNYKLGSKVKAVRTGHVKLNDEQRQRLNKLGFVWNASKTEYNFDTFYNELLKFKTKFKTLLVPQKYISPSDVKLGIQAKSVRGGLIKLSQEQRDKLNKINFIWDLKTYKFNKFYQELLNYQQEYGNLSIPEDYITPEGYRLGKQAAHRRNGEIKLTEEQVCKLNKLGFIWNASKVSYSFPRFYEELEKYKQKFGDLLVPQNYVVTSDEYKLGNQVSYARIGGIVLSTEERAKLDKLGFIWKTRYSQKLRSFDFNIFIEKFLIYKNISDNLILPYNIKIENYELGFYARNIRTGHIKLTEKQKVELEKNGFIFDTSPYFSEESNNDNMVSRMLNGDKQARIKVLKHFYKLVPFCARKVKGLWLYKSAYNYDDLVSLGEEELINAVDKFAPKTQENVTTYCNNYLKKSLIGQMKGIIREQRNRKEVSLDSTTNIGDQTLQDTIPDPKANTEQIALNMNTTRGIKETLKSTLSKNEYMIVCLHFGLTKSREVFSLAKIAKMYNRSEKIIKQTLNNILKKLKRKISPEEFEGE